MYVSPTDNVIGGHSVQYHQYADGLQVYLSLSLNSEDYTRIEHHTSLYLMFHDGSWRTLCSSIRRRLKLSSFALVNILCRTDYSNSVIDAG